MGFDDDAKAAKLIADCQATLKKYEESGEAIPAGPKSLQDSKDVVSAVAKSQADERLKEELARLEKNENKDEN